MPRLIDTVENIADEYMEGWGFDSGAMDDWLRDNWKWPDTGDALCSSN